MRSAWRPDFKMASMSRAKVFGRNVLQSHHFTNCQRSSSLVKGFFSKGYYSFYTLGYGSWLFKSNNEARE